MECSEDCKNKVGLKEGADLDVWHHTECPNHSIKCCGANEPEDFSDTTFGGCTCVFTIPVCAAKEDHMRRMALERGE